jgi:hypothetical protein
MADFCNVCSHELYGDVTPEIDVYEILEGLGEDEGMAVLCEGCGMSLVGKSLEGKPILYFDFNEDVDTRQYTLKEWESGEMKQI